MQDPDPFADPGFLDRLGKLLPMLGSGQANEADNARRKLLEHLKQHRLTLTDVATRLRPPAPGRGESGRAGESGRGLSEAELRRELDIVRHAQRASEQMARSALQQNALLQNRVSRAETAQLTGVVQRRGERIALFAASVLAVGLLAVVAVDHLPDGPELSLPPAVPLTMQPTQPPLASLSQSAGSQSAGFQSAGSQSAASQSAASQATGPQAAAPAITGHERLGTIVSHDVAVRADPAPDSRVQGFLGHGADVVVVRETDVDGLRWLMVRSSIGIGYVPSFSVALN